MQLDNRKRSPPHGDIYSAGAENKNMNKNGGIHIGLPSIRLLKGKQFQSN